MSAKESAEKKDVEEGRSVFSLRGAGLSVARVDPHVAGLQTSRIAPPLAIEEELVEIGASVKKLTDTSKLITSSVGNLLPHYAPWGMANTAFLLAIEVAASMASTMVGSPDVKALGDDVETVEEKLREFGNSVVSFALLNRMVAIVAASQVGLSLPAGVRSNAVNEERAGISIVK